MFTRFQGKTFSGPLLCIIHILCPTLKCIRLYIFMTGCSAYNECIRVQSFFLYTRRLNLRTCVRERFGFRFFVTVILTRRDYAIHNSQKSRSDKFTYPRTAARVEKYFIEKKKKFIRFNFKVIGSRNKKFPDAKPVANPRDTSCNTTFRA